MKELFCYISGRTRDAVLYHKNTLMVIAAILCLETYLSYKFYSGEPEFPTRIFQIDVFNAISRDLVLLCLWGLCRKHFRWLQQAVRDYRPIAIAATLWIVVSLIIVDSLNLIVNAPTIISILTGIINNIIFLLLGAYLYTKPDNRLFKALHWGIYFFTILIFYSDTAYFLVTSTHIESVMFDNLNSYSIIGVLYTADKLVLMGILASFVLFMFLFHTPHKLKQLPGKHFIAAITLCVAANALNAFFTHVYPAALLAKGYYEEAELEKSRNSTRNLLSKSVTINLIQALRENGNQQVFAADHFHRVPFSAEETKLLGELGIAVAKKPDPLQNTFPYKKVVVIVAESFHRDYLHFYNSNIPPQTTQFIDSLLATYPHVDNYFTASKPTTPGLNSMFLSQVIYSEEQAFADNITLFKSLEYSGYDTVFLEATSQYYDDEYREYKKRFGMQTYRAKEDLERQGYSGSTGWGFHNDVMYAETVRMLEENRDNKVFIVTKTIDSHQPYPYCGYLDKDIPSAIKDNIYLRAIYWEDTSLKQFFHDLEERNLLDDKTLIIFTSDHNPHPSNDDDYVLLGQGDLRQKLAPIPLIFVSRNLEPFANLNNASFASQIDFAPTLLGVLGIPVPTEFSGKSILNTPAQRSYALGNVGETVYYWSKDKRLSIDMYTGTNQNAYQQALTHWVLDRYNHYFLGNSREEN